jgi:hypothetical protein
MPVLANNRIFFHMPKTGGTWVQNYLVEFQGGRILPQWGGHARVQELPPHLLANKTLFGTKRDPWSWYASWYLHAINSKQYHDDLRVYGNGDLDFASVLQGATRLVKPPKNTGVIWPTGTMRHKAGLFSWAVTHIYGEWVELIEAKDLATYLGVGDIEAPPCNTREVREVVKTTDELYTDELRALVWERDHVVASRLGYDLDNDQ